MKTILRSLCIWITICVTALVLGLLPYAFVIWHDSHDLEGRQHLNQVIPPFVYTCVRGLTWLPYQVAHRWVALGSAFWDHSGSSSYIVDSYWSFSNPYMLGEMAISFAVYFALFSLIEILRRIILKFIRSARSPAKA